MSLPLTMKAVVTTAIGGPDVLSYRDVPRPDPAPGEVLIRVGACGLNNTDVNTRSGWYSKAVTEATTGGAYAADASGDGTWGGRGGTFPRIQGADAVGEVVAVGEGVDAGRVGERVILDGWLRDPDAPGDMDRTGYFGSERDGGFAEYATIPAANALAIRSDLTDAELATFSCSYSTALGMVARAGVGGDDTVLVTGASGGVGGALVQLCKLRGARVLAMVGEGKEEAVAALGADRTLPRAFDAGLLSGERVTVIADVVGGPDFAQRLEVLARGGRYVTSGAIAGPIVDLDLRTLYLRDLTFHGSTVIGPEVMSELVRLIEAGSLRPMLAATYPLADLAQAQAAFVEKRHVGNIVVLP
ncbi:MAG: zinc-binding dehydrogenase [Paracoccaceae bacterium]